MNVFKNLFFSYKAILGILLLIILLIGQVYCDLELPSYTSKIIDVGIMQDGIEDGIPEKMSNATYKELSYFFDNTNEKKTIEKFSTQKGDLIVFDEIENEKTRTKLRNILEPAEIGLLAFNMSKVSMASMRNVSLNMLQKDQIQALKKRAIKQVAMFGDTGYKQAGSRFVSAEYKKINIDIGDLQFKYLIAHGGMMLLFTLCSAAFAILVCLLAAMMAGKASQILRQKTFEKILSFSKNELEHFSTASLINRTTNDVQQIQIAQIMILRIMLYAPVLGIGAIIKVVQNKTGLEWIIPTGVGIMFVIMLVMTIIVLPRFKQIQILLDKLGMVAREILTGLPVIRAFNREKHEQKRYDNVNVTLRKTQIFVNRVFACMFPVVFFIMNVLTIAIVWFAGHGIEDGSILVGQMMAFIQYALQIVMAFLMLSMVMVMLPRSFVSADRLNEVNTKIPSITFDSNKKETNAYSVEFKNVSFSYKDAEENVLSNITFTAEENKTTAIIGGTGSGKSTLVSLIPRLFDVTKGSIKIGQVKLKDFTKTALNEFIGFVPQKAFLFSGTVRANMELPNKEKTDEEIFKALDIARAKEFVINKKKGLDLEVSSGGDNFSGGQRQRLAIARAINKDPKILIFDDSFSALDYKTDSSLRKEIKKNIKATVIVVAQRISTIMEADKIIVLDNGKIVGEGTHKQLLKKCKVYKEIAEGQLSKDEL